MVRASVTTKFRKSDDEEFWIGTTSKGVEFFFDGDDEIIEYIRNITWRTRTDGYIQNYKGERLHRVVMKVTDSSIIVDHINNNPRDNRKKNLRIVSRSQNSRNRKAVNKNNYITGLRQKKNAYFGCICVNGVNFVTKHLKDKNEAIIDLLIVQREYGFNHNENMFYLLTDVSSERVSEVLETIKSKIEKKGVRQLSKSRNEYILSDNKMFYTVLCNELNGNNSFKISADSKSKVDNNFWYIYKIKQGKYYVKCTTTGMSLHRFILGLTEPIYNNYVVDHINGDSLDNRLENLIITDKKGNNANIIGKGYYKTNNGKYRAHIAVGKYNYTKSKIFYNEVDAREWYLTEKKKQLSLRLEWKNKEELDSYIKKMR